MHFRILRPIVAAAVLALLAASPAWSFPSQYPLGTTVLQAAQVAPGEVLYTGVDDVIYIIDAFGNVVWTWSSPIPDTSVGYAKPIANGNVLVRLRVPAGSPETLVEVDRSNGNIVWSYIPFGYSAHHDHDRLANGNTLILCHRQIDMPVISDITLQDDCIIEVDPSGTIVWEWQTASHFHQFGFSDEVKQNIRDYGGDWAHANSVFSIPPDAPGTDPRFKPGNLLVSYRHINVVAVIDRETGAIVHTFDNLTTGQHHAHMIPMNRPGGGNFMIFDNGYSDPILNPGAAARNGGPVRRGSRVIEFDPTDPDNPVWTYDGRDSGLTEWSFFSTHVGYAQRLANGNTVITEGPNGRIFEVTTDGEIVWEYIVPVFGFRFGNNLNQVYRGHKIEPQP